MLQHLVSAATEPVHSGAVPSISLVSASETPRSPGLALIIPQQQAGDGPIHPTAIREAIFPATAAFEIILILTLSFIMGGLVKTRLASS
jgi:hypothetical protein